MCIRKVRRDRSFYPSLLTCRVGQELRADGAHAGRLPFDDPCRAATCLVERSPDVFAHDAERQQLQSRKPEDETDDEQKAGAEARKQDDARRGDDETERAEYEA